MEINNVKLDWGAILEGQIRHLESVYPDLDVRKSYKGIVDLLNSNKLKSRVLVSGINVAAYAFVMGNDLFDDRLYGSIGFTDVSYISNERLDNLLAWAESIAQAQGKYLMVNEIFRAEDISEKYLSGRNYTQVRRDRLDLWLSDFRGQSQSYPAGFDISGIRDITYQEYAMAEYDAYKGTKDIILFHTTDEVGRLSLARAIFDGQYGEIIPAASIILKHHSKLIGAILIAKKSGKEGNGKISLILDVFVDAKYRGNGLGRTLLNDSLRKLGALGYESVELWVTEGNIARNMYEEIGFRNESHMKETFFYAKP